MVGTSLAERALFLRAYASFSRPPVHRDALRAHQARRLRWLLPAVAALPYYCGAGLDPTATLEAFPIIDRQIQRAHFAALNTRGLELGAAAALADSAAQNPAAQNPATQNSAAQNRAARNASDPGGRGAGLTAGWSSGTSGERGLFLADRRERALFAAAMLARLLPGALLAPREDRVALFLRSDSALYHGVESRRLRLEHFSLAADLEESVSRLAAFAPTLVIAPPRVLRQLDWESLPGGVPLRVYAAAERLDEIDASPLRAALGARLHQIYQASEGHLGQTCALGTLHLNEDLLLVEREWLDTRRFVPVVTDLYRRTQPLVRYRMSDILAVRSCTCGSPMAAVEVVGRREEVFRSASGPVYPDQLAAALRRLALADYRLHELAPGEASLWVSPAERAPLAAAALGRAFPGISWVPGAAPGPRDPERKLQRITRAGSAGESS